MTRKIFTLADARDEKRAAELPALARAEAAAAAERHVRAVLAANPQIGVLGHGASLRFYAYIDGYGAEPFVSASADDVAARLAAARA